jgi:hypothetical protein
MAYQNNKPTLHRKEFQMMTPAPAASIAGSCIGVSQDSDYALYIRGNTEHYLYDIKQDGFARSIDLFLSGTFAAGTCIASTYWGDNIVSVSGSTSSVILTNSSIFINLIGKTIRAVLNGQVRTIVNAIINPGGTSSIYLDSPLSFTPGAGDAFSINTGGFYVLNAYTSLTSDVFRKYDIRGNSAFSPSTTGLPASWGTVGILITTPSNYIYATGTATSGTSTTLVNSTKTWATNQWANYQVRISEGVGAGQARTIVSNTATTLTISGTFSPAPSSSSTYSIEANDTYVYLMGNNSNTFYRLSSSTGSWTTLAPVPSSIGGGGGAAWIGKSGNSLWADESNIRDGRYIYVFRGLGLNTLMRYDIALNTWATITYVNINEPFSTGTSYSAIGSKIYIQKESTGRFFCYDVTSNQFSGVTTDLYPQSTALVGNKLFVASYNDNQGGDVINWIYYLGNTSAAFRRLMIY